MLECGDTVTSSVEDVDSEDTDTSCVEDTDSEDDTSFSSKHQTCFFDKAGKYVVRLGASCSVKPVQDSFYTKPSFHVSAKRLSKALFWKCVDEKLNDPTIKDEDVLDRINSKIQHILDYFVKFRNGTLTQEDIENRTPNNAITRGTYLPDPAELTVFKP